jgi:4,5-DOPA dioxygenase extradiol
MTRKASMATPTPVVFFGHGNPMNAIGRNSYTETWSSFGKSISRPRAVLSISAHWYLPARKVTEMKSPPTIHDFGGFPRELYQVSYPSPGDPDLANRLRALLAPFSVEGDDQWGLDHGTWSVLRHVFPSADVPVVQLSIDLSQPPTFHYNLGKALSPLRDDGILIMGSGNVVHNLHAYAWGQRPVDPFDWSLRFEEQVRQLLVTGDDEALVAYEKLGPDAKLAVPTPDHYLPLLYVIALRRQGEHVRFITEGIDGGSVSMLAIKVG